MRIRAYSADRSESVDGLIGESRDDGITGIAANETGRQDVFCRLFIRENGVSDFFLDIVCGNAFFDCIFREDVVYFILKKYRQLIFRR